MEEIKVDTKIDTKPRYSLRKLFRNGCILVFALILGYVHYKYVSNLFENSNHFSHLSELEREMTFATEMGFYYSYYKTIVEERPFIVGISKVMYDRLVEYPTEVNAFNRFNIHPEVMLGAIYRYLEPWLNTTAHRQCHVVDRGEEMAPVESCVGIGQPVLFYLEGVWWLAGLMVSAVFVHATALSESFLGGMLAVLQYFANHAEVTRVQWAPNERENFAAPLFFLQAWLVTVQLRDRDRRTSFQLQVSIFMINCLCLLFWQFTQFIFLTQTAIFFVMEQLGIIDLKTFCIFLHSHFCGLHMAVLLLQGNDMLKTSLYTSFFLTVSAYCLFFSSLRIKVKNRLDLFVEAWLVLLRIAISICASLYLKRIISDFLEVDEDSHIWDILLSKFTEFQNFHTLLYTCSDVFDFLPWRVLKNGLKTCLLPIVILNCFNVVNHWIGNAVHDLKGYYEKNTDAEPVKENSNQDDEDSGIENSADTIKKKKKKVIKDLDVISKKIKEKMVKEEYIEDRLVCFLKLVKVEPAIFYNVSQMFVFGAMAALAMRLKLLFLTQSCIVSSLLMNSKYYIRPKSRWIHVFWTICLAVVVRQLVVNVSEETSVIGEFGDAHKEQLLQWIAAKTSPSEAFAGSMPLMAAVMLSTRRPIVAHPHYEHRGARDRVYAVYKAYGRFSAHELYQELSKLKATYLVLEIVYCYGRSSQNCNLVNSWDIEAPSYKGRPKLCHTLFTEPTEHFYRVFSNEAYSVFKVHDLSVSYMPRYLDT